MKADLLGKVCCPHCQARLTLEIFRKKGTEIEEGVLKSGCGRMFPVIGSIPRFQREVWEENQIFVKKYYDHLKSSIGLEALSSYATRSGEIANRKAFEFEWLHYDVNMGNEQDIFLAETQIAAGDWSGKLVLDAGCGMGRYTTEALRLGAEVIGVDLGINIEKSAERLKNFTGFQAVQADLLYLPFKRETFDIVYSLGVLHHTPAASQAFQNIAALVKKNGLLSVWVYGRAGKYRDFITNPLRFARRHYRSSLYQPPLSYGYWLAVKVRECLSAGIRLITVRLPHKALLWLCHLLAAVGVIPVVKFCTYSVLPGWPARVWENFDWLSPYFQSHHTKEEVREWFEKAGFAELSVLPHGLIPKPGFRGKKIKVSAREK